MKKMYYFLSLFLMIGIASTNAQNCTASFVPGSNGLTVNFTDSSSSSNSAGVTSYSWDFGDSSTSTLSNPSHTYASSGTYYVCLTIGDNARCTDTYCDSVKVTGPVSTPCNTSYSYSVDSLDIAYFTSSTNLTGNVTYSWNFGDASALNTTANPSHQYTSSGAYGVTLTVSNGVDSCQYYDTVYVNYCAASFSYAIKGRGSVVFTNYSGAAAGTNYFWTFGNGDSSFAANPSYTYATSGTYYVTLTLSDTSNGCSSSYTDSVVISLTAASCNASYTIAKDSSSQYKVILYNTSTNASTHVYTWDFGDGTTGSGRTPSHTYQSFGAYKVCLTINDTVLNCISTFCDTVGMDSLGNLKAGFGIDVRNPVAVGIDEQVNSFASLSLYPNPATEQLNIDLSNMSGTLNLKVLDLSGRVVLERNNNPTGNVEKIDVSQMNRGIYFVLFDNGFSQKIEKIIIAD